MNTRRIALLAFAGLGGLAATGPAHADDAGWRKKVAALIGANYSYPRSAQLRGEQGSARVKITFSSAGKVVSVDLIQSTGSAILDREAVRIPMKVAAFPAPPTGSAANVVLPIIWRIDER
jgi:protein TonB